MKKTNYHLLSLLCAVPLVLTGCTTGEGGGGGNTPAGSKGSGVSSVKITGADETTVLDGTRVSLKAAVTADDGVSTKVTWKSSDEAVAKVQNGVVSFGKVSEEKKVTITATSSADANKSDSVEFTVEHSPFDLKNSRGGADTSLYLDDGSFIVEDPTDIALIYADVHATRWYVETTMQIDKFLEGDPYPKVGIMASDRDDGAWCYEGSHQIFYFVDSAAAASTWSAMNVVMENDDLTNWDWGHLLSPATASPAIRKGEAFKLGLMRDGNKFYQFYGKATDMALKAVGSFEYNSFGEEANYVWVGGWASALTVSDPVWMVGDEIDSLYTVPEGLRVKSAEEVLFNGESCQIQVEADGLWDRNKVTYISSDPTIAAVDAYGHVTAAADKTGEVTITVGLQGTQLATEVKIIVTDDLAYRVVLDGEMNDAIWSETVKTNAYKLAKNANNYEIIYAAKNSKGLYLFIDYVASAAANNRTNEWWSWANLEFKLAGNDKVTSHQYWLSAMNGGEICDCSTQTHHEIYCKAPSLGEDNLYHGVFEAYLPYGCEKLVKGEETYICMGTNYEGKAGWVNTAVWRGNNDGGESFNGATNLLSISEDGFAHDGVKCSDGHVYGQWTVDSAANCTEAGSQHRECAWCGHIDTEVIPVNPEAHVYDYTNAQIATYPTCSTTGVGTCACTKCNHIEETVLPVDYTNHSDAEYPASHAHCHDCGIGSYLANAEGDVYDRSTVGGPWDKAGWHDFGLFEGNFTFTIKLHMEGCKGAPTANPDDNKWRTILPFVYKEGYAGTRDGHFYRMDWCGFGGEDYVNNINDGEFPAGFDYNIINQALSNMDIDLVYTKVGAVITLDWVWTCLATEGYYVGKTFEYHQGATLIDPNAKLGIALAAEFTYCLITKAELAR